MLRFYKAIRPSPGFYVDEAPNNSPLTVELFAQVRSNGRILDNIRHVLGGSILLEGGFSFKKICRREDLAGWTANFTMRPRNITLRKGMLTSLWTDVSEMIAARNMDVMDNNGTSVSAADFNPEDLREPGRGASPCGHSLGSDAHGVRSALPPATGTTGGSGYAQQQACLQKVSENPFSYLA